VLYENLGIRIDRDGTWFYHGSAIQRKELVCLFASALTRDGEGRHWLVTPTEMGPIEVEDAPFVVVELFAASRGREQLISMRTNIDEIVTLGDEHPLHITSMAECETMPYVVLRRGLQARLSRSVYYDLVALGCESDGDGARQFGVWSSGRFFPMGTLDPAR